MGKAIKKSAVGIRRLRSLKGLRSMVELAEDGSVASQRGELANDLSAAIPNFLRAGAMIGRSLGLDECQQIKIILNGETVMFTEADRRRSVSSIRRIV